MKNKFFQRKIELAKRHNNGVRRSKIDPRLGIRVYHDYSPEYRPTHTWWDDLSFKLGSQLVFVTFLHPRYEFDNWVSNENTRLNSQLYDQLVAEFMVARELKYKQQGRSRKTLQSVIHTSLETRSACRAQIKESLKNLRATTEYRQNCYFRITQTEYGRNVVICAPIEIRDERDLVSIRDLVIDIINNRKSFDDKFGNYSYGREEWAAEVPLKD